MLHAGILTYAPDIQVRIESLSASQLVSIPAYPLDAGLSELGLKECRADKLRR
jgi:hypothetical protein